MEGNKTCVGCGRRLEPGVSSCLHCGREAFGAAPPASGQTAAQGAAAPFDGETDSPAVGTGEWFVTLLLLGIPLVNLVLLLVWAFGGSANPSKRNFSKAVLAFVLIAFVVWLASFAAGIAILGRNPDLERRILEMLGEMVPG